MKQKELIIIGGGAAGFFCAVNAARMYPELRVTIIEKSGKLLSKVKVSGGGRCNVTHACFSIADMTKQYPRGASFLKKAFHQFFTTDTISWFAERGVTVKTEPDGRMFPESNSSQTIIDCLLHEANRYGVEILMHADVKEIIPPTAVTGNRFTARFSDGREMLADYVCIACGGFAKAEQFNWIKQLGHSIEVPVPSLFTFNMPGNPITALMGITVEQAQVKIIGSKLQQQGPLLITHWGMSGPAILKLSAWAARELADRQYHFEVMVNWVPAYHETSLKEKLQSLRFELAPQKMVNRNPFQLPSRLWEFLLSQAGIPEDTRWADLPAKEQNLLVKILCSQVFTVKGKTTFKEEFVTAGGIKLDEVDVQTMQSKIIPGLFFAGELLNVDGVTGGYNFQNAWTTGWIAAEGIRKKE